MQTIYLSRTFQPIPVDTPSPGDKYTHPDLGDCRRITPRRLCLAAERAGKDSVAVLGLLSAIVEAAGKSGDYDGRAIDDWYGLLGLSRPEPPPSELVPAVCPRCKKDHYALMENGSLWNGGLCMDCASANFYAPN